MGKVSSKTVENIFISIPKTERSIKIKEALDDEFAQKMEEYINQGYRRNLARKKAEESLDNLDERLADIMPTTEFLDEVDYYSKILRKRTVFNRLLLWVAMFSLVVISYIPNNLVLIEKTPVSINMSLLIIISAFSILVLSNLINMIVCLILNKSVPSNVKQYLIQKATSFSSNKSSNLFLYITKYWFFHSIFILSIALLFNHYVVVPVCVLAMAHEPTDKLVPKEKKDKTL